MLKVRKYILIVLIIIIVLSIGVIIKINFFSKNNKEKDKYIAPATPTITKTTPTVTKHPKN